MRDPLTGPRCESWLCVDTGPLEIHSQGTGSGVANRSLVHTLPGQLRVWFLASAVDHSSCHKKSGLDKRAHSGRPDDNSRACLSKRTVYRGRLGFVLIFSAILPGASSRRMCKGVIFLTRGAVVLVWGESSRLRCTWLSAVVSRPTCRETNGKEAVDRLH